MGPCVPHNLTHVQRAFLKDLTRKPGTSGMFDPYHSEQKKTWTPKEHAKWDPHTWRKRQGTYSTYYTSPYFNPECLRAWPPKLSAGSQYFVQFLAQPGSNTELSDRFWQETANTEDTAISRDGKPCWLMPLYQFPLAAWVELKRRRLCTSGSQWTWYSLNATHSHSGGRRQSMRLKKTSCGTSRRRATAWAKRFHSAEKKGVIMDQNDSRTGRARSQNTRVEALISKCLEGSEHGRCYRNLQYWILVCGREHENTYSILTECQCQCILCQLVLFLRHRANISWLKSKDLKVMFDSLTQECSF